MTPELGLQLFSLSFLFNALESWNFIEEFLDFLSGRVALGYVG